MSQKKGLTTQLGLHGTATESRSSEEEADSQARRARPGNGVCCRQARMMQVFPVSSNEHYAHRGNGDPHKCLRVVSGLSATFVAVLAHHNSKDKECPTTRPDQLVRSGVRSRRSKATPKRPSACEKARQLRHALFPREETSKYISTSKQAIPCTAHIASHQQHTRDIAVLNGLGDCDLGISKEQLVCLKADILSLTGLGTPRPF